MESPAPSATEGDPESSSGTTDACDGFGQFCEQMYEWTGNESLSEATTWLLATPLKLALIWGAALVLNRLGRRWARRMSQRLGRAAEDSSLVSDRSSDRALERADTTASLLRSLVTVLVFVVASVLTLEVLGISAVAAVASAGVLALAIGFGAQSVVADLFAGVFMVAEDQFGVGDRVDAGPVNGYVERLTLRTTVIRDSDGKLWHVPNSQIEYVANETQSWSRAVVIIGVSYSTNLRRAVDVLDRAARDLADSADWRDDVLASPSVQAVQELGADAVDLRVLLKVPPERRREAERALRLCCKEALDEAGIEMPNHQLDVHLAEPPREPSRLG